MKISIITICYHDPVGLKKTLKSIEELDSQLFEWILVNKEPMPEITEMLLSVPFKNFICIEGQDVGIYDAMNIGLSHSSGEYCIFINSGDQLVAHGIAKMFEFIDSNEQSWDIIFLESLRVSKSGKSSLVFPKPNWYIYYSLPTIHQSIVYRRTAELLTGYNLRYRICGDYEITARLLQSGARCKKLSILVSKFFLGGISSQNHNELAHEAMQIQINTLRVPYVFAYLFKLFRRLRLKLG